MVESKALDIIVIEDAVKSAQKIEEAYNKAVSAIQEAGLLEKYLGVQSVSVHWMQGNLPETMRNDEKFQFYDEKIYERIEQKIGENSEKKIHTGILLDVALSKEEYEKVEVKDYMGFKIARGIYERFQEKAKIYVVTAIRDFSSQVLSLMGTRDLIQRYISKALVIDYPSCGSIARTIRYMYDEKDLKEKQEDELDRLF